MKRLAPLVLAMLGLASPTIEAQSVLAVQDGSGNNDWLGTDVFGLGDVDLDGVPDYGAIRFLGPTVYSGRTHTELWRTTIQFVFDMAAVGDVNGDRRPDVIYGDGSPGTVYVVDGATGAVHATLVGPANASFGHSVAAMGDLDGDTVCDFAVGSYGDDTIVPNNGAVRVYSGATLTQLYVVYGTKGTLFGWSVASITDLDQDGFRDLAVGAPGVDPLIGEDAGQVVVYSGRTGLRLWDHTARQDSSALGKDLADAGDLDGDGYGDVLATQPAFDNGGIDEGQILAISGQTGLALFSTPGLADEDELGKGGVVSVGDVNLDGSPDFIAGSWGHDFGVATDAGLVLLCSGADGSILYQYHGRTSGGAFGSGVASLGDMDGNGIQDILVGEPGVGANGEGRLMLYASFPPYSYGYGTGWPGTFGVPTLDPVGEPAIGQTFGVTINSSAATTTACLLFLGFDEIEVPTSKGGTLWVDPFLIMSLPLPRAGLTLTDTLPNDPALVGVNFFLQALQADPGASNGISFTPGLNVVLGYDYQ